MDKYRLVLGVELGSHHIRTPKTKAQWPNVCPLSLTYYIIMQRNIQVSNRKRHLLDTQTKIVENRMTSIFIKVYWNELLLQK